MATEDTKLAVELAEIKTLLTGLIARVDESNTNFRQELVSFRTDVAAKHADHEARLRVGEMLTAQINPTDRVKQLDALQKWQDGWNTRLATIVAIAVLAAGATAWLVNVLGLIKH